MEKYGCFLNLLDPYRESYEKIIILESVVQKYYALNSSVCWYVWLLIIALV